jgi:hypothetical protein
MQTQHHLDRAVMPPMPYSDGLPDVPTLITTRLQLELLVQGTLVDLSAVAEVILSDVGATLQIYRLIGEENPLPEDRPTRMEDCIASLPLDLWFDMVCAISIPQSRGVLAEWERWRCLAQSARELAKIIDGVSPEEAYLVGLLIELGKIPHLLGWNLDGSTEREQRALGLMLADYWHLPEFLVAAIRDQHEGSSGGRWNEMLQMSKTLCDQAITSSVS